MRYTTRDGLSLSYDLQGDGPLLVCQAGGPGRAARYLGDLAGLTTTRTLLRLDARGTGDSDRPADTGHLRMPYVAGDLDDLRRHLGAETIDLLAHSAGAVAAQAFAAAHPDRVGRLVLVTPSGRLQDVVPPPQDGSDYDLLYAVHNDRTREHAEAATTEMDRVAEAAFRLGDAFPEAPAILERLQHVHCPVLVVAGELDRTTGVDAAYAVAASFPHAETVVLPGVGHFPWVEDPPAFLAAVTPVLNAP
jgi:proline iminopeptidase